MKKINKWIVCIVFILFLLVGWIVYRYFTMNFAFLGAIYIVSLLIFGIFYHHASYRNSRKGTFEFEGYVGALFAAVLLVLLGAISVATLNRYFYADKDVYRNIDHHAMRLDGISIVNPLGFMVAGNSPRAFFDDESIGGEVVVSRISSDSVRLRLVDFRRAFYMNEYDGKGINYKRSLLNARSLPHFSENQRLQMQMADHSVYELYIEVIDKDSVDYHIVMPDGNEVISDEHRFLTKGLPFNMIMRGVNIPEGDFSDLHLVRDTIDTQVKKKEQIEVYKNVNYCVEVQNFRPEGNYVVQMRADNNGQWTNIREHSVDSLSIPYKAVFGIGYDVNSTRPVYFTQHHPWMGRGHLALLYKMPLYHYLSQTPEKGYSSVSVRTSLATDQENISTLPDNILLFDVFSDSHNQNNMQPFSLSFVAGETNRALKFNYKVDGQPQLTTKSGDRFLGTTAIRNNNVEWLASVENLKETSPYQAHTIKKYVMWFAVVLAILLIVGTLRKMNNKDAVRHQTFTIVELVAYAVTLYLVTFRWFLLWRTSVFPPVENVSYYQFYGIFRNADKGQLLIIMMTTMVVVVFFAKLWMRYSWARKISTWYKMRAPWFSRLNKGWVFFVFALLYTAAGIALAYLKKSSPSLCITIPVLVYFLNSVIIDKALSSHSRITKEDQEYGSDKTPVKWFGVPMKLFCNHLLNSMVISLVMLVLIDSGYGILFFTFSLFWIIWLLQSHVGYFLDSKSRRGRLFIISVSLFAVALIFRFYKRLIKFASQTDLTSLLPYLAVTGIIVALVLIWILKLRCNAISKVIVACGFAIIFAGAGYAFQHYLNDTGKHTAQRIAVHFSEPEEVMRRIETDGAERRYLQAALNHMIIGEYTNRGENVALWGENGHGYFKMQPHSLIGALWNVQLTDISLVRFVIAEHSEYLPLVLVVLFLLMIVCAALQPAYHRWARSLLIQIPLLLFVHSLLIWMATTQRFIFLGQDFPMVSINSKLTLIYYFGLVLVWIVVAIYEHTNYYKIYKNRPDNLRNNNKTDADHWRFRFAFQDSWRVAAVLIFCLLGAATADRNVEHHSLKLTELMIQFTTVINDQVNPRLLEYQENNHRNIPLRRDMSGSMRQFSEQQHIDSLFADFPFGRRLWQHFVEHESRNNSSKLVLYARLNRQHRVQLKTNNFFYNRSLPKLVDDQWQGNLVAVGDTVADWRLDPRTTGGLTAYRLPSDWMSDGKERTVVSCLEPQIELISPTSEFTMRRGITSAALIDEHSRTNHPQDTELQRVILHRQYFARNVMVNSNRMFFFPQGASMFWVKNLADELFVQKNNIKKELRKPTYNADVVITLSEPLTQEIYQHLATINVDQSSVIVANGNGDVMALVSRDRHYQLDPNDRHIIRRMTDSLEMYGLTGTSTERQMFGNLNLMHIKDGPGSSQKPLVWTAVASQLDMDWEHLMVDSYDGRMEEVGGHYIINEWNGRNFIQNHPFRPLTSDEHGGAAVSVRDYMTYSSNVYNGLMAYIGSFPFSMLSANGFTNISPTKDEQTLFARISDRELQNTEQYRHRFPVLRRDGNRFTLNKQFNSDDQPSCLLVSSMHDMFFRNDTVDDFRRVRYASPLSSGLNSDSVHISYAFVENSYLNSRQGTTDRVLLENAIRQTAIGAQKIWEVTPWKMAESFGRMASLNRSFYLSVLKRRPPSYHRFENLSRGYCDARPLQMKGMSDVFTDPQGTASGRPGRPKTGLILGMHQAPEGQSNQLGGYYIYAKTGTIGENNNDRHRFGVIITNQDLAQTSVDDLADLRFVVIYFTVSTNARWNMYAEVIRSVMDSPEFISYMIQ